MSNGPTETPYVTIRAGGAGWLVELVTPDAAEPRTMLGTCVDRLQAVAMGRELAKAGKGSLPFNGDAADV